MQSNYIRDFFANCKLYVMRLVNKLYNVFHNKNLTESTINTVPSISIQDTNESLKHDENNLKQDNSCEVITCKVKKVIVKNEN